MRDDNDQHYALNDYLDTLAGAPPPASRAGALDAGMQDSVDQFFDLADQTGMAPRAKHQSRRRTMNATLPASTALPSPKRGTWRRVTLPRWTRHLHLLSTGLLIAAVIALSFAAFGPDGLGGRNGGTGDSPGHFSAVPMATIPDDAVTSSIPYPTADECTVEPMTRDELIKHFTLATAEFRNDPKHKLPIEEPGSKPSEEETEAIMGTYRTWQACGLDALGPKYQMQLQTPLFTTDQSAFFYVYEPPFSDYMVESWVDFNLADEPSFSPATPAVDDSVRVVFSTIFPEDIWLFGPRHAMAQVYFVDPATREITLTGPLTLWFEKVNGQWKLDFYST